MASQPQTQSYSYNYSYSWQTNQGPVNTVSGGGQTSQPPPTWPQPSPSEPAKEQEQPTVTDEKSDEAPPPPPPSSSQIGAGFDHTYLRSIEGILRLISIVITVIFFIINIADYRTGGEWFNICVSISWIIYAIIVIVIEVFVNGVYVHRLIDGVICLIYLGLFCLAVLIALIDAARFESVALGIAVIFGVAVAILIGVNAFFALRTWRTYEDGKKGSVAIFII